MEKNPLAESQKLFEQKHHLDIDLLVTYWPQSVKENRSIEKQSMLLLESRTEDDDVGLPVPV